jgi:hypothetical protein
MCIHLYTISHYTKLMLAVGVFVDGSEHASGKELVAEEQELEHPEGTERPSEVLCAVVT